MAARDLGTTLKKNQGIPRLETFLTNWNLPITDKWIFQAVSGYKIPFLRPPHHWRARPTVAKEGHLTELMKGTIQALISMDTMSVVDPRPHLFQHSF